MAADCTEEDYDGQVHNPLKVHHARVWAGAFTVQLVPCNNAAVQFFDSKQ